MREKIEHPRIRYDALSDEPIPFLELEDELHDRLIENRTIENLEAGRRSFDRVMFRNVTIASSALEQAEFTDAVFENCDFSNINFAGSLIHRTEFRKCKIIGADFSLGILQNVQLTDCIGDYTNFRYAKFKHVRFEDCSLIGSDFYAAALHKFFLSQCNIDRIVLAGAKLKGIDLSNSRFQSLTVNLEDLEGCTIAADQAPAFARLLGLNVVL